MNSMNHILLACIPLFLFGCGSAQFSDGSGSSKTKTPATTTTPTTGEGEAVQDPVSSVTPTNEIVFGTDVVYHIGDNTFSNSTCLNQIQEYDITGKKFFFEFEIVEANTSIDVSIGSICGVDYNGSNFVSIGNQFGATIGTKTTVMKTDQNIQLQQQTLPVGRYAIIIESAINHDEGGDYDDFITGKITVKADKKVIPGQIRTE